MDWLTFVVVDPVKAMSVKIWSYVPSAIGALVILVVGWLIAKLLEAVTVRVLKSIRLDEASEKAGVANVLAHGEIRMSLSELIGAIIYWLVILVVMATALNALNLSVAADLVSRLVGYVPNILAAIFILVLGSFLANLVATIVRTSASNIGTAQAKMLGRISQTIIIIFATIMAIEQLKVATALLVLGVNIILISIGLGIALAFGLGCKEMAARAMADWMNSFKK